MENNKSLEEILTDMQKISGKFFKEADDFITKQKEQKKKIELEKHNFRINSDGWKKKTVDGQDYLENPEGDVWELINCEDEQLNGEQLFTYLSAMRETKKAGKRIPTDEEFTELLKTKEDVSNIKYVGYRYNYDGSFLNLSKHAYFWSSSVSGVNAWLRNLYSSRSTVYRYPRNQADGFSVRCVKHLTPNTTLLVIVINTKLKV